jgi:CTP synthase (UTP-ammonia lyase)
MMRLLVLSIFLACVLLRANSLTHAEAKSKIEATIQATDKILSTLTDRWQINEFPNFLTAVEMSETSWEVLKVKYLHKILSAITSNVPTDQKISETNKFVISLLGSSVTAGHDSHFNVSVSEMTRLFMKPAFDAAGINFIVRNGAMGNNPCIPYDVCVKAFAGADADLIQWEQVIN